MKAEKDRYRDIKGLAEALRFHRKQAKLSQAELARLAGVGKTVVFQVEKGKQSVQLDTVRKLLAVLNIRLLLESPLMEELAEAHAEKR